MSNSNPTRSVSEIISAYMKKLGEKTSARKRRAARENGKLGGRPKKKVAKPNG